MSDGLLGCQELVFGLCTALAHPQSLPIDCGAASTRMRIHLSCNTHDIAIFKSATARLTRGHGAYTLRHLMHPAGLLGTSTPETHRVARWCRISGAGHASCWALQRAAPPAGAPQTTEHVAGMCTQR